MKRLLAALGVIFACGMCLVVVAPTPAVALVTPPIPPPAVIPPVAVGVPTTTVGGTGLVGVGLAGVGAFDGTCYVLEQLFLDEGQDGCDGALGTVFNFVFGTGGDERPIPSGAYWTASGPNPKAIMNYAYGGYKNSVAARVTCANASGTVVKTFWKVVVSMYHDGINSNGATASCGSLTSASGSGPFAGTGMLDGYPLSGGRSANTICGVVCDRFVQADFYQGVVNPSTGIWISGVPATKTVYAEAAEPWTLNYTVTCQKGPVSVDVTASVQFTPTPGGTAPQPDFPQTCEQALPGSHVRELAVSGGRDTIENPEVNVVYPTYNDGAAATYPLCTTHAPAGGCFLDLQKDGKSCFGPNVYCAGWPQNVTRWKMSCEWGPYQMDIDQCTQRYSTTFNVLAPPRPTTTPSVPPVEPEAPPCYTNCTTPPIPPDPPSDPKDGGDNCISDAFSLNPIDWVYVPVKCALKWAFVPTSFPDFGDIPSPIPAGWIPSFPALTNGSCGPLVFPSLEMPMVGSTGSRTIVNTCSAPWPVVRGFTYYGLLAVGLVGLIQRAFDAVTRAAGMDVDTPQRGGDD